MPELQHALALALLFPVLPTCAFLLGARIGGRRREMRMRELDLDDQHQRFMLHVFETAVPLVRMAIERSGRDAGDSEPPPASTGFARAVAGLQHVVHDFDLCDRCTDAAAVHMEPGDGPLMWSPGVDQPCRRPGCRCPGFVSAQGGMRA